MWRGAKSSSLIQDDRNEPGGLRERLAKFVDDARKGEIHAAILLSSKIYYRKSWARARVTFERGP